MTLIMAFEPMPHNQINQVQTLVKDIDVNFLILLIRIITYICIELTLNIAVLCHNHRKRNNFMCKVNKSKNKIFSL